MNDEEEEAAHRKATEPIWFSGNMAQSQQEKNDQYDRRLVEMDRELEKAAMCVERVDNINHPAHYTAGGIETIDYMEAKLSAEEFRGYCRGAVLKYVSRAGKKGPALEDLQKAEWYLKKLISLIEGGAK